MIKKKKIIINTSAAIRACGSRPVRRPEPHRASAASPRTAGTARLAAAGGGAGTICPPPLAALGLSVRPGAAAPAPGLRAASHAPGAPRSAWLEPGPAGARGAGAGPRAGRPLAPEGALLPVPLSLPQPPSPHRPTHTRSHSLSCCSKQVEDLCNDIMPFNKNFMRCI